jgi:transporter family-2 protein
MPQFSTHLALAFAIVAGMVIPVQAGANGRLGRLAEHPLFAALTSAVGHDQVADARAWHAMWPVLD